MQSVSSFVSITYDVFQLRDSTSTPASKAYAARVTRMSSPAACSPAPSSTTSWPIHRHDEMLADAEVAAKSWPTEPF
jgi:hypothetical protein